MIRQIPTTRTRLIIAFLIAAFISACGPLDPASNLENKTAEEIYAIAEGLLAENKLEKAAEVFLEVERLWPYSELAKTGLIMSAKTYYDAGEYDQSRLGARRYLDFYPTDTQAAYAQYLIALSYYDQIDDVSRDQGVTLQALQALRVVIERYDGSNYARSALLKFDLALDHLGGKEMEIGRYYLKRSQFGAAINRFRVVVEDYQTTTHTPEALHRLVESYLALGLTQDAQTAAAILGHNFRATEWYKFSYKLLQDRNLGAPLDTNARRRGWLGDIYSQVIRGKWL